MSVIFNPGKGVFLLLVTGLNIESGEAPELV